MKATYDNRPHGNGRQMCCQCHNRRSIAGLKRGQGLCPYHWAVWAYGLRWANQHIEYLRELYKS